MSVSTQNALLCLPKSKVQQGQERLRAISASRARDVNQLRGLLNSAALNSYEALAKSRSQILECVLREEWRQCGEEEVGYYFERVVNLRLTLLLGLSCLQQATN